MREIIAKAGQEICIGKRGENNAVCVVFDISDWQAVYGAGNVQLIHQRNGDKIPYPCVVEVSGVAALWTITKTDVGNPGVGRAELQYWVGDSIVKSEIFSTKTARSMGDTGEVPPEPATTWLEQMQQLGIDTEENAEAAEASAQAAAASAASVKTSEESAAASARSAAASEASVAANAQSAKTSAENAANSAATAEAANSEIAANKAAAESAARSASDSASAAAQSAAEVKASENNAATSANAAAVSAQSASVAQSAASSSASAASSSASAAAQSEAKAATSEKNAADSETAAKTAQAAAEKARDEASEIVGGDFASKTEAQGYANTAESNANKYTDEQIAAIPAPDVSGQINSHNTSDTAHDDIRQAVSAAQSAAQTAAQGYANTAESNAKGYTDQKIAAIPTPDVSGQIQTHNTATDAHSDIRQAVSAAASAAATAQSTADGKEASGTAASAVSAHNTNTSAHNDIRTAVSNAASAAANAASAASTANTNATNALNAVNGVPGYHVWEKWDGTPASATQSSAYSDVELATAGSTKTYEYSTGYEVASDGTIKLKEPVGTTSFSGGYSVPSAANVLVGKYIKLVNTTASVSVQYIPANATLSAQGLPSGWAVCASTLYYINGTAGVFNGLIGYVWDASETAYPKDGWIGNYCYKYTKTLAAATSGGGAQIETGSYTGTNKAGSSSPSSLTFGFEPKLVIISGNNGSNQYSLGVLAAPGGFSTGAASISSNIASARPLICTISGNTITWYTATTDAQLNENWTYNYIAFG